MVQAWVSALVAIAVAHLLVTVALYYWLGDDEPSRDDLPNRDSIEGQAVSGASAGTPGDDRIVCRRCGTANETGFRFCRNCVAELPTRATRASRGAGPQTRGMG